jgi:hypothetical protein
MKLYLPDFGKLFSVLKNTGFAFSIILQQPSISDSWAERHARGKAWVLGQKEKQFTAQFDPLLHATPYHWALACKGLFQHAVLLCDIGGTET